MGCLSALLLVVVIGPPAASYPVARYPGFQLPAVALPAGLSRETLREVDRFVEGRIAGGQIPGGVVVIGNRRGVFHAAAYGIRRLGPRRERMTLDTVFEIASLTKPIAGASALVKLSERGSVDIDDPVADYLPSFAHWPTMTLGQLADHTSGLPSGLDVNGILRRGRPAPGRVLERIAGLHLEHVPGSESSYGDLNFVVLARALERASGGDLDTFLQNEVFGPLSMVDTTFRPGSSQLRRLAPTFPADASAPPTIHNRIVRAYTTDQTVAAHAGLFSTGSDLANYAVMLLREGKFRGRRVLSPMSIALLSTERENAFSTIGWNVWPTENGEHGVGHTGWLGTFIWVSWDADLFLVYLTNRTHLSHDGNVFAPDWDGLLDVILAARR